MAGTPDHELLSAWQDGDPLAGDRLVRRHFAAVYRFFWNKVEPEAVDDLVQSTFMACVATRDRLRDHNSFLPYLLGIARRELLQRYRKEGRRGRALAARGAQPVTSVVSPSGRALRHEQQQLMVAALRELPLDLQIIIELYYWEEMPVADVAQVVDVPAGTVKSRLYRAREALREAVVRLAATAEVRESTLTGMEQWAGTLRNLLRADVTPPDPDESS